MSVGDCNNYRTHLILHFFFDTDISLVFLDLCKIILPFHLLSHYYVIIELIVRFITENINNTHIL